VLLTKYNPADQIKKNEMGGEYGTYAGEERSYRVLVGKPEGRPGSSWRILKWSFKK
jgi:hypothetical protein